jgi:glycerophosphoryl diester phosphodiesterase
MKRIERLFRHRRPLVIAHRGFSGRYPENTLAAIQGAIDAGADMVEIDVTLTADRIPVVIHDDTLDRTTDGFGAVRERPWAEIMPLDAGGWFAPEFRGEGVPTLEEVLEGPGQEIALNVELKEAAFEPDPPADALESQVADLVRQHGLGGSVLLSSFEHRYAARVERLPFGLLFRESSAEEGWLSACRQHGAFSCHPNAAHLRRDDVTALTEAGYPVLAFRADAAVLADLRDWGVAGVFTDEPETARRLLGRR